MKHLYREPAQVDEFLLPEVDFVPRDARGRAILEVLCQIPDLDYQRLVEAFSKFTWFIPDVGDRIRFAFFDAHTDIQFQAEGSSSPPAKLAEIIYLSPALEELPADLVHCAVAEKLAHVLLKHERWVRLDAESETRERGERLAKLGHWGFEEEVRKYRSLLAEWGAIK